MSASTYTIFHRVLHLLPDKIRTWLGLQPNILVMLTVVVLVSAGEELWRRFMPRYLEVLGASTWGVAAYGTLHDFLRASYRYPGGWITDRWGHRTALTLCIMLGCVGYGIYLISPTWWWLLLGAFFVRAWGSLRLPTIFSIIGTTSPQTHRAMNFGLHSALRRLPMLVAPVLGGGLIALMGIEDGVRVALGVTVLLAVPAMLLVRRSFLDPPTPAVAMEKTTFRDVWRAMDGTVKHLLLADIFARLAGGIPQVFVILYVLHILQWSSFQFGILLSIQMSVAMLLALPMAKLADRCPRKPLITMTFLCYALFPLVLIQVSSFPAGVLAFALAGLRESGESARKASIVDFSAVPVRGRVVGMYYLLRGLAVFPASLVGGWLWSLHPQGPFYGAFLCGATGVALYLMTPGKQ